MTVSYEGKITSPDDDSEFGFKEQITVTGRAKRIDDDGTTSDATGDIRWRKDSKGNYQGKGGTFKIAFTDRKNLRIAMYVKDRDVDAIGVKIVCDAIDPKSPPSN